MKFPTPSKPAAEYNLNKNDNFEFDKIMKATGDKVVIKRLERQHEHKYGDLIIPDFTPDANLNKGVIISIGRDADKYGLKVGDMVLYDSFSVFYDTFPIVVTKIENVIGRVDEE